MQDRQLTIMHFWGGERGRGRRGQEEEEEEEECVSASSSDGRCSEPTKAADKYPTHVHVTVHKHRRTPPRMQAGPLTVHTHHDLQE